MALVCRGRAEKAKKRELGSFEGQDKIIATIDHQHGDLDVRREIHRVCFWPGYPTSLNPTVGEHGDLEAVLEGDEDRSLGATPTKSVVADTAPIDFGPSFQVVERSAKVFPLLDRLIPVGDRPLLRGVFEVLKRACVDGEHHGAAALDEKIRGVKMRITIRARTSSIRSREKDNRLIRR